MIKPRNWEEEQAEQDRLEIEGMNYDKNLIPQAPKPPKILPPASRPTKILDFMDWSRQNKMPQNDGPFWERNIKNRTGVVDFWNPSQGQVPYEPEQKPKSPEKEGVGEVGKSVPVTAGIKGTMTEARNVSVKDDKPSVVAQHIQEKKRSSPGYMDLSWIPRLGSDLIGAGTGRGVGQIDKFLGEESDRKVKLMRMDPNSQMSQEYQEMAKEIMPDKDWSGFSADVIDKHLGKFMPGHQGESFEEWKQKALFKHNLDEDKGPRPMSEGQAENLKYKRMKMTDEMATKLKPIRNTEAAIKRIEGIMKVPDIMTAKASDIPGFQSGPLKLLNLITPGAQNFQSFLSQVYNKERHELFGATLTPNEQSSWDEMIGKYKVPNADLMLDVLRFAKEKSARDRNSLRAVYDDLYTDYDKEYSAQAPSAPPVKTGSTPAAKVVTRKQVNQKTGATRITYSDGSVEETPGTNK